MRLPLIALTAALVLSAPSPVAAQRTVPAIGKASWTIPPEYRQVQQRTLDTHRRLLLAMADSMPVEFYRDHATPPQRDFVEQLQHAAGSGALITSGFSGVARPLSLPDTATAYQSREGMKAYINAAFDYMDQALAAQTDAGRHEIVKFFGGLEIPRWQVWDEIAMHTIWTAGQVVANFRKHGMAPPAFAFF